MKLYIGWKEMPQEVVEAYEAFNKENGEFSTATHHYSKNVNGFNVSWMYCECPDGSEHIITIDNGMRALEPFTVRGIQKIDKSIPLDEFIHKAYPSKEYADELIEFINRQRNNLNLEVWSERYDKFVTWVHQHNPEILDIMKDVNRYDEVCDETCKEENKDEDNKNIISVNLLKSIL